MPCLPVRHLICIIVLSSRPPRYCAGLETFGVKLPEAAKLFGKKFASGASITKNPMEKDQIEVQGDFVDKAAELIIKTYADKGIIKRNVYIIDNKKKCHYFDPDEE